mmetsp:Transcript_19211/g.61059  ORF Transcript_19211/g.61059 Transcript_19211/m.61059 type:complete len:203 (-) Transcript_19211:362-970(-)
MVGEGLAPGRYQGAHQRGRLLRLRGQRHRPHVRGRRGTRRGDRGGPPHGSLGRGPGHGVRPPQPASRRAWDLHLVVRLVRIQLRLHPGHGGHRHGPARGLRCHEHDHLRCHGGPHGARTALAPAEEVRRGRHVQRHPGRPRLHHSAMCQRRVRVCLRHWAPRWVDLRWGLSPSVEAEDRRPHRCLRRPRRVRSLGDPRGGHF